MTINPSELVARLETYVALQRERPNEPMAIPDMAEEAAAVLRAAEADLATARAVTNRYSHGWSPMYGPDNGAFWAHAIYAEEPMSDAERAWLEARRQTPASGEAPAT